MNRNVRYKNKSICTVSLIVINVLLFFWLSLFGMTEDAEYMLEHGAMYLPYVLYSGEYYRIFTCMFLHFGFAHLMNNMVMLGLVGWNLELELGKAKFLLLYLLSGIGGNVASAVVEYQTGNFAVSAGASGAIFGVVGALLYVAICNKGYVGNLTSRGIIIMIGLSLYVGYTSEGVDNFAHLGGLFFGFVLAMILYRKRTGYSNGGYDYER